jgi:predicted metal-dependent hydrolase
MKIVTRNRLAEMLVDAFKSPAAAATLRRLAHACQTSRLDNETEHFLLSVAKEDRAAVVARLQAFAAALEEWSSLGEGAEETPLVRALRKGVVLFNHRLFFEVHEVLEAQWLQESGDTKLFLQGLIQVAVGFHHLENRNLRGARLLLQDGMEKLTRYQPVFLEIELQEFMSGLAQCHAALQRLGEESPAQFPTALIPRLR